MWDLDGNREVSFLRHQNDLARSDSFVSTDFTLYRLQTKKTKIIKDTHEFHRNEDCSLVLSPRTATDPQHFFRTFSGSNLLEIKALKSSIDADEADTKSISYSTYLASFNNLTFFQIFWKNL